MDSISRRRERRKKRIFNGKNDNLREEENSTVTSGLPPEGERLICSVRLIKTEVEIPPEPAQFRER
jgi:hypothetical protein